MDLADSPVLPVAPAPDFSRERGLYSAGSRLVAGVDEAGRGPLAGPVVAAAVVLDQARCPDGLNDSKLLAPEMREVLCAALFEVAAVSVAVAPPALIDRLNIRGATLWAMRRAVAGLPATPDHALIDGRDIPDDLCCTGVAVIGGDALSLSIAAASIVAKVVRDSMCAAMDRDAPGFSFHRHKGYCTAAHLAALAECGRSRHHRLSFAPVAAAPLR